MIYYLIEKYNESERYHGNITKWDVREYKTKAALEEAVLQGPKHHGKLFAAKGLELKVLILESGKDDCSESDYYYGR